MLHSTAMLGPSHPDASGKVATCVRVATTGVRVATCVRVELGLPPGSAGPVRSTRSRSEINAPACRPHGGPALRARVPSALLVAFEKVNGSLDLAGPSRYVDHVPVRIKCGCCKQAWFFDFVWDLCHRIELGLDRWAAFAGSPARRYVLDVLQTQLPALLAGVTLPCVVPLVLAWPECFN